MYFILEKLEIDEEKVVSIVKSICLMCVQSCKRKVSYLFSFSLLLHFYNL